MTTDIQPAAPCCVCSSTGGAVEANTRTPARFDVTGYGVPGVACYACCLAIVRRLGAGLDPITNLRRRPMGNDNEPLAATLDELKAKLAAHRAEIAAKVKAAPARKPGAWPAAVKAGPEAEQVEKPKWTYLVPALPDGDAPAF